MKTSTLAIIAIAMAIAVAITLGILTRPSQTLNEIIAQRDSAQASRDSVRIVAESLVDVQVDRQRVTDSLKAIKQKTDTVIIKRIKYLTPKVAHADSVAPGDTIWKPIAFEVMDQRDSLLANSLRADTVIARQDTTIRGYILIVRNYEAYTDRAERRIGQLEDWQQKQLREFKLFGKIPLPKLQVTAGLNTSLKPDLVAGLGYTVKFGRKAVPPPEPTPDP